MNNDIKCPNCGEIFDVENVIAIELEKKFQQDYQDKLNQSLQKIDEEKKKLQDDLLRFEETKKKENEIFAERLKTEKSRIEKEIQQQLEKSIASDYENKIKQLEANNAGAEIKLKEAREKELSFLQKESALKDKEAELDITIQKKLAEERNQLAETIRQQEQTKTAMKEDEMLMKMEELKKQLEDQKKLADEMKRKADQGSMQLQGEVQELALEELLKTSFPFDLITEVGKGVRGADCILTVRNGMAIECGKIIFESKRTENFTADWIEKLKTDMLSQKADIAVIVTKSMPKDMEQFGEKNGVYICSFKEVKSLTTVLRNAIIKISETRKSEENKGEKMVMLYHFLTSNEFIQHMEAMIEGYSSLREGIVKERMQMEKMWKEREKQLDKVLINTSGLWGSIKGIAGGSMGNIRLLEGGEE